MAVKLQEAKPFTAFEPVVKEPKKTISIVIRIEGAAEVEVHETTLNYEGMLHDKEKNVFSFYGTPSIFQNESMWEVKTAKVMTPAIFAKQMEGTE